MYLLQSTPRVTFIISAVRYNFTLLWQLKEKPSLKKINAMTYLWLNIITIKMRRLGQINM